MDTSSERFVEKIPPETPWKSSRGANPWIFPMEIVVESSTTCLTIRRGIWAVNNICLGQLMGIDENNTIQKQVEGGVFDPIKYE